nr:uncharacterized protein LOC129263513 [Lytechinus pictus]
MEWISSDRGGRKLLLGGYIYLKKKDLADGWESFECELRRNRQECKAKVQVLGDNQFRERTEHSHPPNHGRTNAAKVKMAIKRRATESHEPPQQVLMATLPQATAEGSAALPRLSDIRRNIRRHRQNAVPHLPAPRRLSDLEVPDEQGFSFGGEQFLIHDSGREDQHRIIIFATDTNLRVLGNAESWFADGTFKVVPNIFFQLWTIHAVYESHVVPLVYALVANKTQATYRRVLDVVRERGIRLDPARVTIDFEIAARNAFQHAFPNAEVKGCHFHLCQRIHEKIKQEGLQDLYNDDEEIRGQARMVGALAFVPVNDVVMAFGELSDIARDELNPILNYFEDTYIGRPHRRHRGENARQVPRFPPPMWNVHDITLMGGQRTNNHIEGWHRRFHVGVGADHPSFWAFLDCLKREQALNEVTIVQALAGAPAPPRRREYEQIDQRLVTNVQGYAERHILDYLRGISYNIH